jgi:hypothetical protein
MSASLALWLSIVALTIVRLQTTLTPSHAGSRFSQLCSLPSRRGRRDATTTTFVDMLYLLTPYPYVHSFNMTSRGIHCPSADGEARRRRTLGARCSQQHLQPRRCMHCLARLPSLPCRNHIIVVSLPQKTPATLITEGKISDCKRYATAPF